MRDKIPQLSKSRFLAGIQCRKRLYLECYHYNDRDPVSSSQNVIMESGTKIGELAQTYFPGGRLIEEGHLSHDEAIESTRHALSNSEIPSLYEAAFTFDDIKIRADILKRNDDNSFDLIEVKSSTDSKEIHIFDLSVQLYVLQGCGIDVREVKLMTLSKDYIFDGVSHDIYKLFTLHDFTEEAEKRQKDIKVKIEGVRWPLYSNEPPNVDIGKHCNQPYKCSYHSFCRKNLPKHHVTSLPRVSETQLKSFRKDKIETIHDIPEENDSLTDTQRRVAFSVKSNSAFIGGGLYASLSKINHPIAFIDFEAINPALPIFKGCKPYQQIPFQWSCHTLNSSNEMEHSEFLAKGDIDPRREFAESLIDATKDAGSIIVYSSYEQSRLEEISMAYPDLSAAIVGIVDKFVDLLAVLRADYYHPDFGGSYSIKKVMPALVPDLTYSGLEIADGASAASQYEKIITSDLPETKVQEIRASLLDYCKLDTLAMVKVYQYLLAKGNCEKSA